MDERSGQRGEERKKGILEGAEKDMEIGVVASWELAPAGTGGNSCYHPYGLGVG